MNILEFAQTPEMMGDTFTGESWEAWRSIWAGAFGLPMDQQRRELFEKLAGKRPAPKRRVRELWIIAGRRSAKTHNAAQAAVYIGTIGAEIDGLLDKLSPGERGVICLLAVDRQQAKVAFNYIRAMLENSPLLAPLIEKVSTEAIHLTNRVTIEVSTNSYRSLRGRTNICVLMDEVAFYKSDSSATPDVETYRAAVPGLATTGGMLIAFSSPYARRGLLYDKYRKHYAKDGDVLVVQGGTRIFNPTLPAHVIEEAEQDDPEAARSEWHGLFREEIEGFVSRDTVEAATRPDPLEIPYNSRNHYRAFTDPAGGGTSTRADEFTLAIGHLEGNRFIVDLVRGQRGTPATIVAEYAALLKSYGVRTVNLDRYGGSVFADEFKRHGIEAEHSPMNRSELYQNALPLLNSNRVELPPCDRLQTQLITLERRTARSGRITIDHPPGGHDDRCNAALGLVALSGSRPHIFDYSKLL
ncbi:hypothetical protein LG325_11910 [Marinobacter nauticus]